MTAPVRVFISYAHDSAEHQEAVRELWVLLRRLGVDARLDLPAAERRQDWPIWMLRQVREADFVLVVASPAYRRRAEGDAAADEGRGVQFEAALVREEVYRDRETGMGRFLPVVLPGGSADDIPAFLGPTTATFYPVAELTPVGVERLLRVLTGQPLEVEPPLGAVPVLPSRATDRVGPPSPPTVAPKKHPGHSPGQRPTGTSGGRTGQDPELVLVHKGGVRTLAFSPDGRALATGGPDKAVRIWNLASGQQVQQLLQDDAILDVAFSADGMQLAAACDIKTTLWDVAAGRVLHQFSSMLGHAVAFSPDGSQLAITTVNGARTVSPSTGRKLRRFKARLGYAVKSWGFSALAFNPDGSELAIGGMYGPLVGREHGIARVWNITSGEEILQLTYDPPGSVTAVAFHPSGDRLATAGSGNNVAIIWASSSGNSLRRLVHDHIVSGLAFSPDGAQLATGCHDRFARLWDLDSGREIHRFEHEWDITDVAISPDGRLLAAANGRNSVRVWEIR